MSLQRKYKNINKAITTISTLALAFGMLVFPQSVHVSAQVSAIPAEGGKSWFIKSVKPGETVNDVVAIQNLSDKEAKISITAKDGIQDGSGAFSIVGGTTKDTMVGSWVKLSQNLVTVPAKKSLNVDFSITVPADAKSGEYAGGIAVQLADTGDTGGNVRFVNRAAARVYITVPGEISSRVEAEKFDFVKPGSAEYKAMVEKGNPANINKMTFGGSFKNSGQIFSTMQSNISIKNATGEDFDSIVFSKESMFPGAVVGMGVSTQKEAVAGKYVATLTTKSVPSITENKENIKPDEDKIKTVEFELTATDIAQMQSDYTAAQAKNNSNKVSNTEEALASSSTITQKAAAIEEVAAKTETKKEEVKDNTLIIVVSIASALIVIMMGVIAFILAKKNKKEDKKEDKTKV